MKTMQTMIHECHAVGCDRPVDPRYLMCPQCWRRVPYSLKQEVLRCYRAGQEVRKDPTPEYLEAARAAIDSLKPCVLLRAVTLWQPWATLVALGLKGHETRPPTISWRNYRGDLLIHAAKRPIDALGKELLEDIRKWWEIPPTEDFPLGALVAKTQTTGALTMRCSGEQRIGDRDIDIASISALERMTGDWRVGRLAIPLLNVQAIAPIAATGAQGLWTPTPDILEKLQDNAPGKL